MNSRIIKNAEPPIPTVVIKNTMVLIMLKGLPIFLLTSGLTDRKMNKAGSANAPAQASKIKGNGKFTPIKKKAKRMRAIMT